MGTMPYSRAVDCLGTINIAAIEAVNSSHSVKEVKIIPFLCLVKNIFLIFT